MNTKKNFPVGRLLAVLVVLLILPVVVLLVKRMEGTPPVADLDLKVPYLGERQTFKLSVQDPRSGIRQVRVALFKDGQESVLIDKMEASGNLWAGGLVRSETLDVPFDAQARGIKDGKAVLRILVSDYSWRDWGKGNRVYQEKEVTVDTRPPQIELLSRAHNVYQGGAGVAVYRVSEDCASSGVTVGNDFYPGYHGPFSDPHIQVAFFALNYTQGVDTPISITATDLAGNQNQVRPPHHINARKFRNDTLPISDSFLEWKMPEFKSLVNATSDMSLLDVYLKVNRELRDANYETIKKVTEHSEPKILWEGPFLRLPNAAPRAGYADHRTYTYHGKEVDEQTHLGVDLASLEQSPVPAGNAGKVVFAEELGIYGRSVILDHGCGLFSMYSHMSHIGVKVGQMVARGDELGKTGTSGLAGGDHLHFSVLVNHTFVNPIEWWDPQWIKNNVASKLEGVQ